jgi:hypothetical protein
MRKSKKFDRERLREILERYGGSLRSFDDLRPDAYEQKLAAQSLEQLDLLYSELFAPGRKLEEAGQACPPWPPGTPHAGQRPKRGLLDRIFKRIQTDRTLGMLVEETEYADKFMQVARRFLPKEQTEALDTMMTTISQEIMSAKMRAIPISQQLPPVDRLLTREKVAVRDRERELKEKRLKLEERKQRALEKKIEQTGKESTPGQAVTKEDWEEMERKLKLL